MLAIMDNTDKFFWVDWMIAERKKKGWSQADLSRETGLTRTAISDYEKRERPNPQMDALKRISVALGYPADFMARMISNADEGNEGNEDDPLVEAGMFALKKLKPGRRADAVRILQTQLERQDEEDKNAGRERKTKPA